MKISNSRVNDELGKTIEQMLKDNLNIGLVAYIGCTPEFVGNYFANALQTEKIHLASIKRKNKNKKLAKFLNKSYKFLPTPILKIIAKQYKSVYSSSERETPEDITIDLPKNKNILLVDDNSLTGKTLELWKEKLSSLTKNKILTYSITTTGEYKPDYYSINGWRSFEWRLIGV